MLLLFSLLIGIIAGLRAMTAPAAVSWAVALGMFNLSATPLAFLGFRWTPWILSVLAVGELIADQLPSTPSRKVPLQFGARIVMGALSGGALAASGGSLLAGALAGIIGAVIGTYGGAALRKTLAERIGRDAPAALIENAIAIGGAVLIVMLAA